MHELFKNQLKRIRFLLQAKGYDIIPIDRACWKDQQSLLQNLEVTQIIDAGANAGEVAMQYRTMFPSSEIHCFEPQPKYVDHLKTRFQQDKKVRVSADCLGRKAEQTTFFINAAPDTSSLLRPKTDALSPAWSSNLTLQKEMTVQVIPLDAYSAAHKIDSIQILKMDTQGSELAILEGARGLLSQHKIDLIYTEVSFVPMYEGHALFNDVARYLLGLGYSYHFTYNHIFNGASGKLLAADVIFVSPRLAKRSTELLASHDNFRRSA